MISASRWFALMLWLLGGLYVGAAGWVACKQLEQVTSGSGASVDYHGLNFQNTQELNGFLELTKEVKRFPWIFNDVPIEHRPVITSIAFGIVGGTILLLKKLTVDNHPIVALNTIISPLFSGLVGMMLFLISFLIPNALVIGRNPPRTEALVALSLFGGAFSEVAYTWIESQVKRLFPGKGGKDAYESINQNSHVSSAAAIQNTVVPER